jgi:predicted Zn-dependent peptidase
MLFEFDESRNQHLRFSLKVSNFSGRSMLHKLAFSFLLVSFCFVQFVYTQLQPRQEKLLNGLKVLIWADKPTDNVKTAKTSVRLRIHSGSAFDLKGKTGMMALLTDILFPGEQTKKFFREDLEGDIETRCNYDYIEISVSGKSEEILTILETLATAVTEPAITKENFDKVRNARLTKLEELQKDDAYIADVSIAKRLLGEFPYGRPSEGTIESLKAIEMADLIFAKDRYLTADNATLSIRSNLDPDSIYIAVRRLFGGWKKSDKPVPATFRQPDEPDTNTQVVEAQSEDLVEARSAVRGVARNDKNFFAASVLAKVLTYRIRNQNAQINKEKTLVAHRAHFLPGILIAKLSMPKFSISFQGGNENGYVQNITQTTARFSLTDLLRERITNDEFKRAKSEFLDEFNSKPLEELWLDVDTFKLASVKDEIQKANDITLEDVGKVAEDFKKKPVVNLIVIKSSVPAESN